MDQLRSEERGGRTITLKLRTSNFKIITRSRTLKQATQLAEVIYQEAKLLLIPMINGTAYRLIGIGIRQFSEANEADQADLLNNSQIRNITHIENAMETIRKKFGQPAINKGRAFLKY